MEVKYKKIYYDKFNDEPLAVFEDVDGKFYFFNVSCKTAEDILSLKTSRKPTILRSVFLDMFMQSKAEVIDLTLNDKKYNDVFGNIQISMQGKDFSYSLESDEVILLSVMLNKNIEVNPDIFYSIFEDEKMDDYIKESFAANRLFDTLVN